MSDTTDPRTGFVTHNSLTDEQWAAAQAQAREAAQSEPETGWGDVGQGVGLQQDTAAPLDLTRLDDHTYWLAHKQAFLDAAARGELTNP